MKETDSDQVLRKRTYPVLTTKRNHQIVLESSVDIQAANLGGT